MKIYFSHQHLINCMMITVLHQSLTSLINRSRTWICYACYLCRII